jgi:hypothetical protein
MTVVCSSLTARSNLTLQRACRCGTEVGMGMEYVRRHVAIRALIKGGRDSPLLQHNPIKMGCFLPCYNISEAKWLVTLAVYSCIYIVYRI